MKSSFYAVGWQAPQKNQLIGTVKNFRQAKFSKGFEDFLEGVQFANEPSMSEKSVIKKFNSSINSLENVRNSGDNTAVPFFRKVDPSLLVEFERISKIETQLNETLPPLKNFEKIRFYILVIELEDVVYRFYIKALRTAKLNTRFIMTAIDSTITVTDTKNNGKALPYTICYAEKVMDDGITQYIFNVQDYEDIFGLNESKIRSAKANFQKFFSQKNGEPAEYKISGSYYLKVNPSEHSRILDKIANNKKIANLLSKYNDEADAFNWKDVKTANELAREFMQTPFEFDEKNHLIFLRAESLDAWVSVISNTKKLGVAKHEYEDSLAKTRRTNQT